MIGDIKSKTVISGSVSSKTTIFGIISTNGVLSDSIEGRIKVTHATLPNYQGQYEATPSLIEQIFPTNETSMRNDFVVHKIPYYEIENQSGGLTAVIGA